MNLAKLYSIIDGLSGKGFLKKSVLISMTVFYLVTLLYIYLFEIEWLNQVTPFEIMYGGYRTTEISSYASVVSFLFVIMFLNVLYYINAHTDGFFKTSTTLLLHTANAPSLFIFSGYFFWRSFQVLKINILYLVPLLLLYVMRDGVFVYSLVYNIYILFYSSLIVVVIYDVLFSLTKKTNSSLLLSVLFILLLSLLSFVLSPIVDEMFPGSAVKQIHYLIPDIISIPYQYVLKSFSATYSASKLYYSLISVTILLIVNFYFSNSLIRRLAIANS